jgi:HemY protein
MKFLFWLLLLFALAVALALAAHHPGYVLLAYPPYRVEMSLILFLLLLLALFVSAYLLLHLALAALRLPQYVRRFRAERAREKGRGAMLEALIAFFEGRYATAEKAAARAMDLGENSGLNPIIAARAAHELHEYGKRDAYLEEAKGRPVGEATMRLIASAKFNLDQHRPQAALDALKELRNSGARGGHVGVLRMELRAQQQAHNWDAVLDLVAQLEKRDALDAASVAQIRQQAWLEKIRAQAHDSPALQAVWKSIPAEFRRHTKIAATAARAFIRLGEGRTAQEILSDSLETEWDSGLVVLYGDCQGGDAVKQIEQAERWLKSHAGDAGLLLALGKLCLQQGLWGKAQSYLDASVSIHPSRAAYTALGKLAEKLEQHDVAFRHFRKAMELAGGEK